MLTGWPGPASLVEATWNSCSWHRSMPVSLYVKLSPLTPYVGEREREHDDWGREGRTYTSNELALVSRLVMVTL